MFTPVNLHNKKSRVLVVHCSDPRFQSAYRSLVDELRESYDLLVFPGASKAVAEDKLVLDNIALLHSLHEFEEIHIFDHIECGAFGAVNNEKTSHQHMIAKAKERLAVILPDLKVVGHLVGEKSYINI